MSNTPQFTFVKAVKGKKPLRLVIGGASGSGKTYTSLEFAKYLATLTGKRTAALDTEHGRLSLYADKFDVDVFELDPPFDPSFLIEAIHSAEKAGYGQLIVDSATHFWNGSGGLLEMVNLIAKTQFSGNSYMAWSKATPIQNAVIDTLIRSDMHIIFTTRAKQEYAEVEANGKKRYEKLGLGMIQREGFEYDFDFAIMMDADNGGLVTKGMANVPPQTYFKHPDEEAITNIMDAIQKDSVELLSKGAIEGFKTTIRELSSAHPELKDAFVALKTNYGDPVAFKQESQFNAFISAMKNEITKREEAQEKQAEMQAKEDAEKAGAQ